jgi:hypothetical protein
VLLLCWRRLNSTVVADKQRRRRRIRFGELTDDPFSPTLPQKCENLQTLGLEKYLVATKLLPVPHMENGAGASGGQQAPLILMEKGKTLDKHIHRMNF